MGKRLHLLLSQSRIFLNGSEQTKMSTTFECVCVYIFSVTIYFYKHTTRVWRRECTSPQNCCVTRLLDSTENKAGDDYLIIYAILTPSCGF